MSGGTLVGIQIGAISFVDEGVGEVLDTVQEKAGVNAVFAATQSFDRGVQGRQIANRPYPGHGPRELDHHEGGSYVSQHPEFYVRTLIGPHRAPDREVTGFDVLGQLIPAARERGLAVYSFVLENTHSGLARAVVNWPATLQTDAWGRTDSQPCLRNPDYVAWWLALVDDQVKSYPIDGLMFGSERNGPLGNTIGRGGFARDASPYCFCRYCEEAGGRRGLDVRRAREGYLALHALVHETDDGDSRSDGPFVRFLRLLTSYPEIVAWDRLWHDGYLDLHRRIYGEVKFVAPRVQVGWHVWHHNSFSPLYRAQMDFGEIAEFADFVKPVLYDSCAGYRFQHHIQAVAASLFRGRGERTLYELYQGALGYEEEVRFEELASAGLSSSYVRRETERTVDAVAGKARVYPGLDVNVSSPELVKQTTPSTLQSAVRAALDGGADGMVLSRKYSEMTFANLEAVGEALRERGLR